MARIALVHDIAGVAAVQAQLLRGAGHEVDQIPLPAHGASWRWPAKAIAIPVRMAAFLPTILKLRRGRYDVVHIHFLSQGIVGVLAGVPFFAQAHGSDLHTNLQNPAYRGVTRSVLQRATRVFYVTPNLPAFLDGFQSKLVYLPNPVDGGPERRAPTEARNVLVFTRLHAIKGVERIFPAAAVLRDMGVELTALDYGPLSGQYMTRYGEFVRFVKPIPHAKIGDFLAGFDVVIGQMRQGILSLMEIEALAAGRPVVTAIDWSLYPDDPPPVIAASGPDEIVAAIERLRGAPAELSTLSRRSRDWALRHHGYAHHLALLQATYFGPQRS
jgi:glycosyltransferase involved in cell wall biosynthesis